MGLAWPPQGLLDLPRIPGFLPGEPVCTPHTQSFPGTHGETKNSRESWRPRPCPQCKGHGWEDRTAPTPQLGTGGRAWGWGGLQHLRLNHLRPETSGSSEHLPRPVPRHTWQEGRQLAWGGWPRAGALTRLSLCPLPNVGDDLTPQGCADGWMWSQLVPGKETSHRQGLGPESWSEISLNQARPQGRGSGLQES